MIRAPLAALLFVPSVLAAEIAIAPFSTATPSSSLPSPWRMERVPKAPPAELQLVSDDGATVLESRAVKGAGAAVHPLRSGTEATLLTWRWKIDRVVAAADMDRREGDDFAARVYVFFDVPVDSLPLADRVKIKLARWIHGAELPTAAICYVWDNRHARGTSRWSPYTDRVRVVVLENEASGVGRWIAERRDVAADFRAAFGAQWRGPVPAVTGIALGNDTDQTGETAVARFGDVKLERAP